MLLEVDTAENGVLLGEIGLCGKGVCHENNITNVFVRMNL